MIKSGEHSNNKTPSLFNFFIKMDKSNFCYQATQMSPFISLNSHILSHHKMKSTYIAFGVISIICIKFQNSKMNFHVI